DLNNPEEIITYFEGVPESNFRFYYETYDDDVAGINRNNVDLAFDAYPNPFTNELRISLNPEARNQRFNIRLIDLQGRTVYTTEAQVRADTYPIHLPELQTGIYQLMLQDASGKTATKKL